MGRSVPSRDQDRMVGQADHDAVFQSTECGIVDGFACFLVDDLEHVGQRRVRRFRGGPACQRLGDDVEEGHSALGVDGNDRVADAGQGDAEPFLLLIRFGAEARLLFVEVCRAYGRTREIGDAKATRISASSKACGSR